MAPPTSPPLPAAAPSSPPALAPEPPTPTSSAPLTISLELGLSSYSPDGLLGLIADRLLIQLGGPDRWLPLLESILLREAQAQATTLVEAEVTRIWSEGAANLNFPAVVQSVSRGYLEERTEPSNPGSPTRLEDLAKRITRSAAGEVLDSIETDWKSRTNAAIREALRTLPNPAP